MNQAHYSSSVAAFLASSPQTILGHLAEKNSHDLTPQQRNAWLAQVELLQKALNDKAEGWIALEFTIPRMGKRVDAIALYRGIIFVIEFKVGEERYAASAIDQVVDYTLDLKNFHAGSHSRMLVPLLVATNAPSVDPDLHWASDGVVEPQLCNGDNFGDRIAAVIQQIPPQTAVDHNVWCSSGYKPTPTIVEAAQALYRGHRVEEITRSDAGAINLTETTGCLEKIVEESKLKGERAICFVTGVPGAGKTLAGLNLVTHRASSHEDEHAVFLSGNGPLVAVLREALARDEIAQARAGGVRLAKDIAARKVNAFIQNIHHFRDEGLRKQNAPIEHVVVFDEAQRAWDQERATNFMAQRKGVANFDQSEPEFLISVMNRHTDWCVVVCLIGGGQEINAGEAGLTEWFLALKQRFSDWKIYTSPQLGHRDYHWGRNLSAMIEGLQVTQLKSLHLAVSIRSFRAETLSEFVGALVAGEIENAHVLYEKVKATYPIVLTRDLGKARTWLRSQARGSERFGFVASSGASRLKPEGLNVHEKIEATYWFLNSKEDVRSSFYLEDPATEFDVQGLELDWVGVCWDADFRFVNRGWSHHKFRGTAWQRVNNEVQRNYLTNAYRVLLTRARQGMVIFVPSGDKNDPTRLPAFFDGISEALKEIGLDEI